MEDKRFNYSVRKNDDSIKHIRGIEEFFGLDKSNPRLFPEEYINLYQEIFDNEEIMGNFEFKKNGFNQKYIFDSKRIWKDLGIILQDVQYLKQGYDVDTMFKGVFDQEFHKNLEVGSPLNIPIKFTDKYLETQALALRISTKKGNYSIFKNVILPRFEKKIDSTIYAHELAHAELDDVNGGILTITNRETVPILIEQLFADKLDENGNVLELSRNNRLASIATGISMLLNDKSIDFESRLTIEMYLISTMQGIDLANKYFNGSSRVKEEIIGCINEMFKGNFTTEDTLKRFDSFYFQVEPSVKSLKKIKKSG